MSGPRSEIMEIEPNISYLSAAQLIEQRHVEAPPCRSGLKRTHNQGTATEINELEIAYANLRAQLAVPRIERLGGRSLAKWHTDKQAAEVIHKEGKFQNFGYSEQGKFYLDFYEALFLLELDRLELQHYGLSVSIEQAYLLMLGEDSNERFDKYIVYSALSRAGYIVVQHKDDRCIAMAPVIVSKNDCIWALLLHNIKNIPIPDSVRESPFYAQLQIKMEADKQKIICQQTSSLNGSTDVSVSECSSFKFDTRKRSAETSSSVPPKKKKYQGALDSYQCSFVSFLKTEPEYVKFQEIFDKLDIVQVQSAEQSDIENNQALREFTISFDLHMHNVGFKKSSPEMPSFHVVILKANEPFPMHDEIAKCARPWEEKQKTPLLIISVNESKQIQGFIYHINE